MDYHEWAAAYLRDADRIQQVIDKKKSLLNDKKLSADTRKIISDTLVAYRRIYRDLLKTAETLQERGGKPHEV